MKKIISNLISFALMVCIVTAKAQGVAINTDGSSANESAILDIESTTQGMLVPRMNQSQREGISSPVTGLIIYQTDNTPGFYYYNGSAWTKITNAIRSDINGNIGIGISPTGKFQVYYDLSNDELDNDCDFVTDESTEGFTGFSIASTGNYYNSRYSFGSSNANATVTIHPKFGYPGELTIDTHYNLFCSSSIYPCPDITITNWYGMYVKSPTGSTYVNKYALITEENAGNVGIGTATPARILHVKDVMRLEPRSSAPSSPSAGDLYFDSSTNKLRCYDGTTWQDCW